MRRGLTAPTRRRLVPLSCAGAVAGLALGVAVALPGFVGAHPLPGAPHCTIFPPDNAFNQRVDRLPVARGSGRLIAAIGLAAPVHPDFGSGTYNGAPIGIPITVVSRHTRRVRVSFGYASESDRGPYPIPPHPAIEGGPGSTGDRHVLLLDRDACRDYELFSAHPAAHGRWQAGSGALFNLRSDHLRPAGWTSADAAGLPILPGLARYDEVTSGSIDHALRFTAKCTSAHYVYPARHFAVPPDCPHGFWPPMGLRVRLKAGVDIAGLPYQARIVAQALKRYGMILADNGSPWFISGAPDRRWDNSALHVLDKLHGSDFEVVNTASLPHPGL
jgi:hypothetical protein